MKDQRQEAIETAEAINAHCELAHNEPDLLLLAKELLRLNEENESLVKFVSLSNAQALDIRTLESEVQKLTADSAALVEVLQRARRQFHNGYEVRPGSCDCPYCLILAQPHPGAAILDRVKRLEQVASAAKQVEEIYWNFDVSMKVLELKRQLEAVDAVEDIWENIKDLDK